MIPERTIEFRNLDSKKLTMREWKMLQDIASKTIDPYKVEKFLMVHSDLTPDEIDEMTIEEGMSLLADVWQKIESSSIPKVIAPDSALGPETKTA